MLSSLKGCREGDAYGESVVEGKAPERRGLPIRRETGGGAGRRGEGEPQRRQRRQRYRQQQPAIFVLIFTLNDLFSFSSSWSPSPYLIPHPPVTRHLRSGISPGTQSLARTKPIYSKKKGPPRTKVRKRQNQQPCRLLVILVSTEVYQVVFQMAIHRSLSFLFPLLTSPPSSHDFVMKLLCLHSYPRPTSPLHPG